MPGEIQQGSKDFPFFLDTCVQHRSDPFSAKKYSTGLLRPLGSHIIIATFQFLTVFHKHSVTLVNKVNVKTLLCIKPFIDLLTIYVYV